MFRPKLREYEVNHIKTSVRRCTTDEIASELGRAKSTIEEKLSEIRAKKSIASLCEYARFKKDNLKNKTKRRIKGGM